MDVKEVGIDGVLLISPKVFGDHRGCFVETWNEKRYQEAGIDLPFVQDNFSLSSYGVLRGLHFQRKHPQGKLVSVSLGSVFDVVVDIRKGSQTFGKWFGVELNAESRQQLWVPPGLAHGFVVTSEIAHFQYKCTDFYYPEYEGSILYNDAEIGIEWPVEAATVSEKDKSGMTFAQYKGQA